MNVKDATEEVVEGCRVDAMFERQWELVRRYWKIEARNGTGFAHVDRIPVDLHDRRAQALLKDMAWRATEEATEATIALRDDPDEPLHAKEEVADALHFLIELMILSGLNVPEVRERMFLSNDEDLATKWFDVPPGRSTSESAAALGAWAFVEPLGAAMNCLKQKPWKQTHVLTDQGTYLGHLHLTFARFPLFARRVGVADVGEMVDLYFKKSQVNRFRQRSNY